MDPRKYIAAGVAACDQMRAQLKEEIKRIGDENGPLWLIDLFTLLAAGELPPAEDKYKALRSLICDLAYLTVCEIVNSIADDKVNSQ